MPAKDVYHEAVKNALIKEGWAITADPYFIIYRKLRLVADLGADQIVVDENQLKLIIVDTDKEVITQWIN
ncbi:element excision factor XisH family protein [Spirulina sp. 06S082]|uniref:element excision factor XisH family protein n=1 Tax=Spirulina sp. 06S082 TaxID=3110248 RepID=UPI002B1F4EEE|nr:element excision factor XisH family protein [Spirulina sp. 06S082]MEA5467509.1 element excision factor XisH family protein [Spirulina sp. 06S082]